MQDILLSILFVAVLALSTIFGAMFIAHTVTNVGIAFVLIMMWWFICPFLNLKLLDYLS